MYYSEPLIEKKNKMKMHNKIEGSSLYFFFYRNSNEFHRVITRDK